MTYPVFPPIAERLEQNIQKLFPGNHDDAGIWSVIGKSLEGRPIYGVEIAPDDGSIPVERRLRVSITAGAHSDEPAGPLAALALIRHLLLEQGDDCLLNWTSWRICPHVNPDGAERNAVWMGKNEEAPDFLAYCRHAFREPPGEDVEFLYPMQGAGEGFARPRPENEAVAAFLREGGPYDLHFSLHGMAVAEGAWWLIGSEWAPDAEDLIRELRMIFDQQLLGVHDIDRHGEKGFTRLTRGFATTPSGVAMRRFFEEQGDRATARCFLNSSMEFVRELGGDPLVMVSEIPIFRIHRGGVLHDPPGPDTPFQRFRPRWREARDLLLRTGDDAPLRQLAKEFAVRPVPWERHLDGLIRAICSSVKFMLERRFGN